jgi:hypothetical protein
MFRRDSPLNRLNTKPNLRPSAGPPVFEGFGAGRDQQPHLRRSKRRPLHRPGQQSAFNGRPQPSSRRHMVLSLFVNFAAANVSVLFAPSPTMSLRDALMVPGCRETRPSDMTETDVAGLQIERQMYEATRQLQARRYPP